MFSNNKQKNVNTVLNVHIPDGFLDLWICVLFYIIMITYFVYAYQKGISKLNTEGIVWVSNLAAIIFVAQMLNWPLPGGTSLHFVGGALAGIILGPALGFFVLFIILLVQCLVFHDGGITALGANVFNMAIVDVLVGYYTFRFFKDKKWFGEKNSVFLGAFIGGWIGITIAGLVAGFEIGISKQFIYGLEVTLLVMGIWHFILGVIEGIITGLVVLGLYRRGYSFPISFGGEK